MLAVPKSLNLEVILNPSLRAAIGHKPVVRALFLRILSLQSSLVFACLEGYTEEEVHALPMGIANHSAFIKGTEENRIWQDSAHRARRILCNICLKGETFHILLQFQVTDKESGGERSINAANLKVNSEGMITHCESKSFPANLNQPCYQP